MPLDPTPLDAVALGLPVKCLPEIDILYRLLAGSAPTTGFPALEPFGDTLPDILRIGGEHHLAGLRESGKGLNGGSQLHAVVGGFALPAMEAFFPPVVAQQCPPP